MGAMRAGRLVLLVTALAGCLPDSLAHPRPLPAAHVQAAGLELNLIHINDMHARYEETNKFSGSCSDKDSKAGNCYGGHARVATVIKEARLKEQNGGPPVLFLNAGDNYQGTVYYSIFKYNITTQFVNMLGFDAVTLGNHEFDDHTAGLVPYVKGLTAPLVVANADFSGQPELGDLNIIKKSVVVTKGGFKIGIIGYITPETAFLSSPDNVSFRDEVEAVSEEAARLKNDGVEIIIGLGHSGYETDKVIAAKVPDIDVVVGGHSHSFLYTGNAPDVDVPVGLYPTWIEQASGRKVPVVQAYAFTKYMGNMNLKFDANGELSSLTGGPILLNKDITPDAETQEEVLRWKSQLDERVSEPIGRTTVLLDGSGSRREESNLGNLIADGFVYNRAEFQKMKDAWTDAPIALLNGGSIRTSIDASQVNGTVTIKDVMEVIPFDNLLVVLKIRGSVLLEALEHGVSEYVPGNAWKGSFLQVAGLRVTYDVSRPPQQRVVSALARCGNCLIPSYSAVDPEELYGIVVTSFMANGGDGFDMLANNEGSEILQDVDSHSLEHYVRSLGVVYPGVEGRITFVTADGSTTSTAPQPHTESSTSPQPHTESSTSPLIWSTSPATQSTTPSAASLVGPALGPILAFLLEVLIVTVQAT